MKKVLLINLKRRKCKSVSPHLGLAMLTSVLKSGGHKVLTVDYQYYHTAPDIDVFIKIFQPDVVGVSLYTGTMQEADCVITKIARFNLPIIVGGPHTVLYWEQLEKDNRIDYIVIGEAENIINELVDNVRKEKYPQVIRPSLPDINSLPFPDFTSFFGYKNISIYPLSTSRGCPYQCGFCMVHLISSRKWRPRDPKKCIDELINAKKILPQLKEVVVYDDNPTVDTNRFKEFLKLYMDSGINLNFGIINTHAKNIDEETVRLLKKINCNSIGLGVEHAHPEVFEKINKGEKLEDIERASKLIKKYGLNLNYAFMIGLPGDSYDKIDYSINFAKRFNVTDIFWNMYTPYKGTPFYQLLSEEKAVIRDFVRHAPYADGDFKCEGVFVVYPTFNEFFQKKAYYKAIMKTKDPRIKLTGIPKLFYYASYYALYIEFLECFFYVLLRTVKLIFYILNRGKMRFKEIGLWTLFIRGWKFLRDNI